jgi:hypothetical protein
MCAIASFFDKFTNAQRLFLEKKLENPLIQNKSKRILKFKGHSLPFFLAGLRQL